MTRTVSVAAVQMASVNGDIRRNLGIALPYVEQAARKGARLVVLPELMSAGYVYSTEIWNAGEPLDGPSTRWMRELSQRLGLYIAAGILEVEGEHFYITVVVTTPAGCIAGHVRKRHPCGFEALYARGGGISHVITTDLGRIGVGICWENQWSWHIRRMFEQSVDMVLMPFSAPAGTESVLMSAHQAACAREAVKNAAQSYARALGVPVVMSNKCGPWQTPLPLMPGQHATGAFPGLSTIADSDGRLLCQMGPEPGFVSADVVFDPSHRTSSKPRTYGFAGVPQTFPLKSMILATGLFSIIYALNRRRARRALSISRQMSR